MAEELYCYPRSEPAPAATRIEDLSGVSTLAEMRGWVSLDTAPFGGYYQLRRAQADKQVVSQLRADLMGIAERCGFPDPGDQDARGTFDREAAIALHRGMRILPVDAAQADVWRWLHVWAVPDLLFWRFGRFDTAAKRWHVTPDRIHNRQKGFLARLWWRVELLGEELAPQIGEDEAVALVERTTAVGYRAFGQMLTREHIEFCAEQGITNRGTFLRDVMKRVIRRKSIIEVASLTVDESRQLVRSLLLESQRALRVGSTIPLLPSSPRTPETSEPAEFEEVLTISAASPTTPVRVDVGFPLQGSSGHVIQVDPYVAFSGRAISLHVADPDEVSQGVLAILETEGPATGERVCRAYVTAAGMQHAGPQARMDVKQALDELLQAKVITSDPVGGQSWGRVQFRLPGQPFVHVRQTGPRGMDEIPAHELAAVVQSVAHDEWSDPQDVLEKALRRLGLTDPEPVGVAVLQDVVEALKHSAE